jgi:hypothetical protein
MSGEMEESVVAEEEEQAALAHGDRGTRSSLPQALWRKSIAPVKSLKRVNLANAAGQLLLFGAKVAALEAVRRISQARCRPLWWGLQGIFTIQAPPFNWLQRWSPFQHIAQATQVLLLLLFALPASTIGDGKYVCWRWKFCFQVSASEQSFVCLGRASRSRLFSCRLRLR